MDTVTSKQKISKNFYLHEFLCPCGLCQWSKPTIGYDHLIDLDFIVRLQRIRDEIGISMPINSGARCQEYNDKISDAKQSGHIVAPGQPCRAADIGTHAMDGNQKIELLRLAIKHGMKGFGIASNFVHLDLKNRRALWTY
jgi:uncharacterized protein YcbK (DUF882 family)